MNELPVADVNADVGNAAAIGIPEEHNISGLEVLAGNRLPLVEQCAGVVRDTHSMLFHHVLNET